MTLTLNRDLGTTLDHTYGLGAKQSWTKLNICFKLFQNLSVNNNYMRRTRKNNNNNIKLDLDFEQRYLWYGRGKPLG